MNNSDLLLDSTAVSKILKVSLRTIQNYRNEQKLKYYKFSRKTIRYKASDVVDFLNKSSCCSYQKDRVNSLIEKYATKL